MVTDQMDGRIKKQWDTKRKTTHTKNDMNNQFLFETEQMIPVNYGDAYYKHKTYEPLTCYRKIKSMWQSSPRHG